LLKTTGNAAKTLRLNRPSWNVLKENLNKFDGRPMCVIQNTLLRHISGAA